MKQYFILISIGLLALNLIIIIVTLSVSNWSEVNGNKQMSLTGCVECDSLREDWNFECLAREICDENNDLGGCKAYSNLYKSGYAFLILELLSLLMGLLLLEKKLIWLFKKQFAQGSIAYFHAGLMLCFHLLATILWLVFSKAQWSECSSTSDIYKTPCIEAKAGPALAIANIILMAITLIYFAIVFRQRSALNLQSSVSLKKLLWIKGKIWATFLLGLLTITYVLMLASLTTKSWVSYDNEIEGGLLRCKDCDKVENMSWQCLSGTKCEIDSSSSDCKLYKRLNNAGKAFITFESVSIIFLFFFAQNLTTLIKEVNYGIGGLNYAYAILAMLFNLLACVIWFGISDSQFTGSDLSALDGPSLSVASQFFLIPLSSLFCLIYRLRTITFYEDRTITTTIVEKVQDISIVNITMTDSPKKAYVHSLDNIN